MAIAFCGKRVILTRNSLCKTQKRKGGYIILLPEIGEDLPDKDPLLKENGLPEFNTFSIERAIAAVGKQTVLYEQGIQKIEASIQENPKVDLVKHILNPLEELNVPLEITWGISKALYFGNQSLMPTKYYEKIHDRMIKAKTTQYVSKPIYQACKEALNDKSVNLSTEQRRITNLLVLEGRLNGLELSEKQQNKYLYTCQKIYQKSDEFRRKIELSSERFKTTIRNPNVVRDFPEELLKAIASDPANPQKGPWKVTLERNIVSQFLKHCPDRDLRWNVWQGSVDRGSLNDESSVKTSSNLEDIRDNRIEQAKVLGYKSYTDMSMETKVAGSRKNVYQVMKKLLDVARPVQEKEMTQLKEFAKDRGFDDNFRQWDIDFWMYKYERNVLNYKRELVKEYFPLSQVLQGLFKLIEDLFSVRITEGQKTDVWHTDVRFFDVIDLKGSSNEPVAHLYLDPYSRGQDKVSKFGDSGCMVTIKSKSTIASTKPLVALIFNLRPPTSEVPALLSFNDTIDLFQKAGQALQNLLTQTDYSCVSGTQNVEWDAMNISGNFLINWLYRPEVIRSISSHYQTKQPLPDETIAIIQQSRTHMAGYKLCKELYYGRLDLELHDAPEFWMEIMRRLWKEHFVVPQDKFDSHVTSWVSIFGENWAAAYYGRMWSEMIAADVYSAFDEVPANDKQQEKEISMRFRDTFLSLGGSVPASEVFRRFRGRDPNSKALLKNLGLNSTSSDAVE